MLLFEGLVAISYGTVHLVADDEELALPEEAFRGHVNGLCGAARTSQCLLNVASDEGHVDFAVELLEGPPTAVPDEWTDVVEVSWLAQSSARLVSWDGTSIELPLPPGAYRLQYRGSNLDAARESVALLSTNKPDRYALVMWPSKSASRDHIVRCESTIGGHFHAQFGASPR